MVLNKNSIKNWLLSFCGQYSKDDVEISLDSWVDYFGLTFL